MLLRLAAKHPHTPPAETALPHPCPALLSVLPGNNVLLEAVDAKEDERCFRARVSAVVWTTH